MFHAVLVPWLGREHAVNRKNDETTGEHSPATMNPRSAQTRLAPYQAGSIHSRLRSALTAYHPA